MKQTQAQKRRRGLPFLMVAGGALLGLGCSASPQSTQTDAGASAATRTDRQILVKNVGEAIGVVLDRPRGVLFYTSATGQLGRVALEGTGNQELLTKAGALTGIVAVDGP
jgi:hypothetical protein